MQMKSEKDALIFVTEDNKTCLAVYTKVLAKMGYTNVRTFESGTDCLQQLHLGPAIILLDYNLGAINGLDVLKQVKRFDAGIFVILLSSQNDIQIAVDALKFGAFDYIEKHDFTQDGLNAIFEKIFMLRETLEKANKRKRVQTAMMQLGLLPVAALFKKYID